MGVHQFVLQEWNSIGHTGEGRCLDTGVVEGFYGIPKFTNEVQHFIQVLPWDENIHRSPLKSGVRLPDYMPWTKRSGKSLQLWIARHRPLLGS